MGFKVNTWYIRKKLEIGGKVVFKISKEKKLNKEDISKLSNSQERKNKIVFVWDLILLCPDLWLKKADFFFRETRQIHHEIQSNNHHDFSLKTLPWREEIDAGVLKDLMLLGGKVGLFFLRH